MHEQGTKTMPTAEENDFSDDEVQDAEENRQQELFRYRILDTEPEPCFDDLTTLASMVTGCKVSMVSLVDTFSNRLFFKSRFGYYGSSTFPLPDNPSLCLCVQCIENNDDIYVVENVKKDAPEGTKVDDGFLFYAGVPLTTMNGHRLGTLCVLDYTPRSLSDEQKIALKRLACQVESQLEFRSARYRIESLQLSSKELQKQLEEKNRILGVVSHDIRQPLSGIMVSSEVMLHDSDNVLAPKHAEFIRANLESAKYMNSLVGELLEIVQYDLNRSQVYANLDIEIIDMVTFVNRVLMQHVLSANRKNIRIKYGISLITDTQDKIVSTFVSIEHLHSRMMRRRSSTSIIQWTGDAEHFSPSPTGSNITCLIDTVKMEQVLNNLISNAIKYSNHDSTVEVVVGCQDNDTKAYISVRDQGPGIPEKEIHKLFKPFVKIAGVTPTGGESSTGLGLAIVKSIVEAHRGEVKVTSVEKEGSMFKVILPLHIQPRRISSSSSHSAASASSTTEEDNESKYLTILIADDNAINRRLMTQILERRGHDVTGVADGEEALQIFERDGGHDHYDVVVIDEEMPKLNGLDVVRHIREIEDTLHLKKRMPLISISGHGAEEDFIRKIIEAGADATCAKPFKVNDFINIVETHGFGRFS
jgi:signal transduction histidine kinase/CheY-like chemotaxis protein